MGEQRTMSEEKFEQLELDFEGENEMEENKVIEAEFKEVAAPEAPTNDGAQKVAEFTISVMSDGQLALNVNEELQKLEPAQIEGVVKNVYEKLFEQRIAQSALEVLKARLG